MARCKDNENRNPRKLKDLKKVLYEDRKELQQKQGGTPWDHFGEGTINRRV